MKTTLSNIRMCSVTRVKKPKTELLQITKINEKWIINTQPYQGRSFYLIKDAEVIKKFTKRKKFKNFELTEELKEELITYAKNL
ncbi:MAG: DUF448 domain-containing protein [Mycoplasmatales bacterium]